MKKILVIFLLILLIMCISIYALNKINNNQNEEEKLVIKINEEINYLSKNIIEIGNQLNNIIVEDYVVNENIDKIKNDEDNKKEEADNKEENSTTKQSESSNKKEIKMYDISNNKNQEKEIPWSDIEEKIDIIYTTWSQVVMDLYKTNVNGDIIIAFERDTDELYKYIRNKDKKNSIALIVNIYSYIPKFISEYNINDTRKINLENTKLKLINSYYLVEDEKWNEVKNEIINSEEYYNMILNDIESNKSQYRINKIYILLKEYENSIDSKEKNIIYLRYKNLIEELIRAE